MSDHTIHPRRAFLRNSALLAGSTALIGSGRALAQTRPATGGASPDLVDAEPGEPGRDYTPVVTPNGATLPWKLVDGVKIYHLIAEEVDHELAPGLRARTWGYNGRTHGPTIEAVEGDRVRIYVTNRLGAPTTVHWHGMLLPAGMDGVGGLTQRSIHPGETFKYEFVLRQHGTLMYHSHHDEMTQMAMGMMGMFVIHPRNQATPRPDRDFAIMLSEWAIKPGTFRPDPNEMTDFNVLTMNARAFPGTEPLVVRRGQRVRIRLGNLSAMDHHPIHLHGYAFRIVATDGGDVPESAQHPDTTVLVAVGQTRDLDFVADASGDWAMHCHMTHHVMNQMGHDIPNMIGVEADGLDERVRTLLPDYMTMGQEGMGDMGEMGMAVPENSLPMVGARGPFDYITMGGMFTILKVRDDISDALLAENADPGWYEHPAGTVADVAAPQDLQRDGIEVPAPTTPVTATSQPGHGGHKQLYTCPMHPEVVSEDPNFRCPRCGMKLVPKRR
jgi:FtsP/CotA-like multicopper oxidase with cupredoxin domain